VAYLAGEAAGQCGPCANGLPALARRFGDLAAGRAGPCVVEDIRRLAGLVAGSGVAVWECELLSPPEDPEHCPPGAVWLVRSRDSLITRIRLFHPAPASSSRRPGSAQRFLAHVPT